MTANIAKYTTDNTYSTNSFNMVEHEMTRRELWMQAAVAALSSGSTRSDAVNAAEYVLDSFDRKFKKAI